jgi:hypothetical protein
MVANFDLLKVLEGSQFCEGAVVHGMERLTASQRSKLEGLAASCCVSFAQPVEETNVVMSHVVSDAPVDGFGRDGQLEGLKVISAKPA